MTRLGFLATSALVATVLASPAAAQGATPVPAARPVASARPAKPALKVAEAKPGLLAKAKVTPDDASATALKQVANGHVTKAMLGEEGGRLVYTFHVRASGQRATEPVRVDAETGAIIPNPAPPARAASRSAGGTARPANKPPTRTR